MFFVTIFIDIVGINYANIGTGAPYKWETDPFARLMRFWHIIGLVLRDMCPEEFFVFITA